jgi:phage baseplate assembly protein W
MSSRDYPHTGVGWAFPVRWEEADDGVAARMTSGVEKVKQSMVQIIRTDVGERRMRPLFGSGASSFVFESATEGPVQELAFVAERALRLYEPRILLERVEAIARPDAGRVDVVVEFRMDRHRRPTSLVVPFYPEPGGAG